MNKNIAITNKKSYGKSHSRNKNGKVRLHDGKTWKIKGETVEHLNEPLHIKTYHLKNGEIVIIL